MNINSLGQLYVVATPIGNLKDITFRALEILKSVDCIVAEDTRHSQSLLQHFVINTPLIALHEHNERERTAKLLERLQKGESIALISDAGTPLISDPGYYLVREAQLKGLRVTPVPGACAAIAALSVAGVATDRFVFEGFLPAKSGARLQRLKDVSHESRTLVFYEAPHRIVDLLSAMLEVWGADKQVVIARELTKMYETISAGNLEEMLHFVKNDLNQQKGEMVVIVTGEKEISDASAAETQRILTILLEKLSVKEAVEIAMKITAQKKNLIYEMALKLKNSE
jgi:16S rRNA (cytidine1402-2'-O)-methyltransferase